ncbi:MAG: thioredoxin family protein [Planctomycetota bacterium]|jgi:thioredoxin-related protein
MPARSTQCAFVVLLAMLPLAAQDSRPTSKPRSLPHTAHASGGWLTDFEQARKQARAGNKDLLMDFTGSDWCIWCIRLRQEVFDNKAFKDKAPRDFVLVEIDFPQAKPQSEALRQQNRRLQRAFGVEGYPTIYLTDPDGRPYAKTGYHKVGPEVYLGRLRHLRKIRQKRDDEFKKAAKAAGPERARYLAAGLRALPSGIPMDHYLPIVDEILALDPDDKEGLRTRYTVVKQRIDLEAAMRTFRRQLDQMAARKHWAEVVAAVTRFRAERKPEGDILQQLVWIQAIAHYEQDQKKLAVLRFQEVVKLDPESDLGKQAARAVERIGN